MNLFFLNLLSDACNDVGVLRVILFLKTLLQYVFTLVPVAAVLWLTIDMTKNVFSQDADTQRKNLGMFVRRCIYLIIVFLIPTIVNLTLSLFAEDIDTSEYSKCMNVTSESIKVLLKRIKMSAILIITNGMKLMGIVFLLVRVVCCLKILRLLM